MSQTKLFSNLYLAKFLDTSAKPFIRVFIVVSIISEMIGKRFYKYL